MLVYYSGWGYWEYDIDDENALTKTAREHPSFESGLFQLDYSAELDIKYNGEATINCLVESKIQHPDIAKAITRYKHSDPARFILCEDWIENSDFLIENPTINKWVKYTKNNIIAIMEDDKPKTQTENERNNMLKLIIGMAIDAYGYEPDKNRNNLTGNNKNSLNAKLQTHGINISDDTIRKYLKEAKELI